MGYHVLTKSVIANISMGKVRIRPWGEGMGNIATNPGAFIKELLIVEKKSDGQPFALQTTPEDRAAYYGIQRKMWGTLALLLAAVTAYFVTGQEWCWKPIALAVLTVLHAWPAWQSHRL